MKSKILPILLLVFAVLTLSLSFSSAEQFVWTKSGLTQAFVKAAENGKLLLVLATENITSDFSAVMSRFIEDEENGIIFSSFVGIRLSGDKAQKFSKDYGIEELPAFVVLKATGEKVWQFDGEEDLIESMIEVIVQVVKPLDLPQIQQFMAIAADKLAKGARVEAALYQQIALHSLELLLEDALKQSKSQSESEDPLRADPEAEMSEAKEKPAPGTGNTSSEEGERFGGDAEDVSYNGGNSSTTAEWGKLPPKLREDVADSSAEEIPPSYREIVEEYFKSLMR